MNQCDKKQDLDKIVPEYESNNIIIKDLFHKRLDIAFDMSYGNGNKILDAGCGNGILSKRLALNEYKVTAIDYNENLIETNDNPRFIKKDLNEIDYIREFDVIICLDVLEHIEQLDNVLGRLYLALRKGGILIISAPTESIWYRLARLLSKGNMSPKIVGHYHNAKVIKDYVIGNAFNLIETKKIPFFRIYKFKK